MRQPVYYKHHSPTLLDWLYQSGIYTAEEMMEYVRMGNITKEQFHDITRYDYDGLMESILKREKKEK